MHPLWPQPHLTRLLWKKLPRIKPRSCSGERGLAVTEIEAIVEPDSVGDDIRRESVAFVSVHALILPTSGSKLVSTLTNTSYTKRRPSELEFVTNITFREM